MSNLVARFLAVAFVGVFSASALADLSDYPVSDFGVQSESRAPARIEAYFSNLEQAIGVNPNVTPFDKTSISIKRGDTLTDIARKYTARNMDPVHFAVALFLSNRGAFRDDNVQKIISGRTLVMPTVRYLNDARDIYVSLLEEDKLDKSTGLPSYRKPEPRTGRRAASVRKQRSQWRKFSELKLAALSVANRQNTVSTVNTENLGVTERGSSVSWEETRTGGVRSAAVKAKEKAMMTHTPTIGPDGVEYCPFCGLPMSVVRRGRLSPDARQQALKTPEQTWQEKSPITNTANQVTVLGQSNLVTCDSGIITDALRSQKTSEFQLLTLSDGSRCIY